MVDQRYSLITAQSFIRQAEASILGTLDKRVKFLALCLAQSAPALRILSAILHNPTGLK